MKILVVEDETKLAQAIAEGLSQKGYATDIISDGEKALARIAMHRKDYDLVILDLMLPSLDGYEVCRRARELGVTLPVLILTARNEMETKVKLLLSGADDYVVKPFSFEELFARIHALLRRPTETVPQVLHVHEIELNTVDRTVLHRGEPVELTLKEFGLLEHLMRRPNEVVTREDLLGHLWDFNYDAFSNVIDVHVKNLRKKLGGEEAFGILETIRGVGYRLRV